MEDGRIKRISKLRPTRSAEMKINAEGLIALPGLIDAHVHLRDMELSYKETFETGTQAAAAGGFTTVIDMPNTRPATISKQLLIEKEARTRGRLFANVAFQGALIQNADELQKMKDHGAVAFKLYLNKTVETFDSSDETHLQEAFLAARKSKALVTVHAEDGDAIKHAEQTSIQRSRISINDFLRAHAPRFEVKEVKRVIKLSSLLGVRVHICHTTIPESVQLIRCTSNVTCEATPHHLLLNHSIFKTQGTIAVCVPPIRNEDNRRRLWGDFREGRIDILASDHAPHTIEEKTGCIWNVAAGIPGLETSLPLMFTQVSRGRLCLRRLVEATAALPATIFRLPRKGRLAEGFDADVVLVDPKARTVIKPASFLTKAKYSPFKDMKCNGAVAYTIVNGEVVVRAGTIIGSANGKVIKNPCGSY